MLYNNEQSLDVTLDSNVKKHSNNSRIILIILILILIISGISTLIFFYSKNYVKIANNEQNIENIFTKLKEMEGKVIEENTSLKNQINEIIQKQNRGLKDLIPMQNQNKDLKELISQKDIEIQNQNKNLKELISQNNKEIQKQNIDLKDSISQKDIKIQTGEYSIDGIYWDIEPSDWRTFKKRINFEQKYERVPRVMTIINKLDSDKNYNLRISVFAGNVDTSGFDLTIQTWADTIIYGVRISWMSFLS